MKTVWNNIEIEGSPQEIAAFLAIVQTDRTTTVIPASKQDQLQTVKRALNNIPKAKTASKVVATYGLKSNKNKAVTKPVKIDSNIELSPEAQQFLSALYFFEPSKKSATGRGALTAKMILSGRPITVINLIKNTGTVLPTVRKTVNRLRAAGCEIYLSTSKITSDTIIQLNKLGELKKAEAVFEAIPSSGSLSDIQAVRFANSPVVIPQ